MINYQKVRESCKSKKPYDKKGAQTIRNFLYQKEHKELKIYPCPICKKWHLTSRC